MKNSGFKKFLLLLCCAAVVICFAACSKTQTQDDEIIGSADNSVTIIVTSGETSTETTTETTQNATADDGITDEDEALEIAAKAFESYDLSVIGNPDRETAFSSPEIAKESPSSDADSPSANSQFADLQGEEVWVVKYYETDNDMSFVYFVIDTKNGEILDSGFMGD